VKKCGEDETNCSERGIGLYTSDVKFVAICVSTGRLNTGLVTTTTTAAHYGRTTSLWSVKWFPECFFQALGKEALCQVQMWLRRVPQALDRLSLLTS
jgi:hypothetical protein